MTPSAVHPSTLIRQHPVSPHTVLRSTCPSRRSSSKYHCAAWGVTCMTAASSRTIGQNPYSRTNRASARSTASILCRRIRFGNSTGGVLDFPTPFALLPVPLSFLAVPFSRRSRARILIRCRISVASRVPSALLPRFIRRLFTPRACVPTPRVALSSSPRSPGVLTLPACSSANGFVLTAALRRTPTVSARPTPRAFASVLRLPVVRPSFPPRPNYASAYVPHRPVRPRGAPPALHSCRYSPPPPSARLTRSAAEAGAYVSPYVCAVSFKPARRAHFVPAPHTVPLAFGTPSAYARASRWPGSSFRRTKRFCLRAEG
jgi:hypothetical protein